MLIFQCQSWPKCNSSKMVIGAVSSPIMSLSFPMLKFEQFYILRHGFAKPCQGKPRRQGLLVEVIPISPDRPPKTLFERHPSIQLSHYPGIIVIIVIIRGKGKTGSECLICTTGGYLTSVSKFSRPPISVCMHQCRRIEC